MATCSKLRSSRRPTPFGLTVPKAFILLKPGVAADRAAALSILAHANGRLAPFKRIRKIELVPDLPKTISGKIKRAQLRRMEQEAANDPAYRGVEFSEADSRSPKGGVKCVARCRIIAAPRPSP